jgi:hypothetical protein
MSSNQQRTTNNTTTTSPRRVVVVPPLPTTSSSSQPNNNTSNSNEQPTTTLPDLDPFLPFLTPEFNPAQFVQPAILAGGDELDRALQATLLQRDTVDKTISALVAMHSDALLATLQVVGTLKREALSVNSDVSALDVSLSRVVRDFRDPYERLQNAVKRLQNIQQAANLLRKIGWYMTSRKKLLAQLALKNPDTREIYKTAQLVGELEHLLADSDLRGVTIIESSRNMLTDVAKTVRKDAQAILERATFSLNQGEIGHSLQAFFNLSELPERVSSLTMWAAKEFGTEAREALSSSSILEESNKRALESKETISTLQRYVLRARVDALLERSLRSWALRAWNVQRVLCKKRDPVSHVLFSDVVKKDVFDEFWTRASQTLRSEIKSVSATNWIREALGEDYARLRRTARSMLARLRTSTAVSNINQQQQQQLMGVQDSINNNKTNYNNNTAAVGGAKDASILLQVFLPLFEDFMSLTITRLTKPVDTMFNSKSSKTSSGFPILPTSNDINTFAGVVQRELMSVLTSDVDLASNVYQQANGAIGRFVTGAEGLISTIDDARRFRFAAADLGFIASNASSAPSNVSRTPAQEHNLTLLNLIFLLIARLKTISNEIDAARIREFGNSHNNNNDEGEHEQQPQQLIPGNSNPDELVLLENGIDGGDITMMMNEDESLLMMNDSVLDEQQQQQQQQRINTPTTTLPTTTPSLPSLTTALKQLDDLTRIIVDQDIGSDHCFLALDRVLADFHEENYHRDSTTDSGFVLKFNKALKTLLNEHLLKFPTNEIVVKEAISRLTQRIVESFLRRVSLARPVSGREGSNCLQRDVKLIHQELVSTFQPLSVWNGKWDMDLDSLEELIQADLANMMQLIQHGNLKKGIVLHYILSSAPLVIPSPINIYNNTASINNNNNNPQNQNRAITKYLLEWANSKNPDDFVLRNISSALDVYSSNHSNSTTKDKAVEKVFITFQSLKNVDGNNNNN